MCFPASKWLIAAWRDAFAGCDAAGRGGRFRLAESTIGFIQSLILDCHLAPPALILMLVLVIQPCWAAMTTGSGNAPFTPC